MIKKTILSLAVATLSLSVMAQNTSQNQINAQAQSVKSDNTLAVLTDTAELEVKVLGVDKTNHTVTVEGIDGNPATFIVSKKVNISNVQVGDKLKAVGAKSVVVSVLKVNKDVTPGAAETVEVKVSSKDSKLPFEEVVKTLYMTAKVVDFNKKTQVATIETPNHTKVTMKVDSKVKELTQGKVKVGDEILLTYTQGFIIGIKN